VTRRRASCGLRAAGAFGLALSLTPAAFASPELDFGFGSRSQALAGAGVAIADDSSAVFLNPSGLARAKTVGVTFGYAFVDYALEANGQGAPLPAVSSIEAGLVVPGSVRRMPVAFGFNLALPDGKLSRLREAEPLTPYWPLDDAGPRLVDIGTGFAARPFEPLVIGAGVGFVASLRGNFHIHGRAVAADGDGAEYGSRLEHAVDADLTASRFPMLGIGFLPSETLAFGLAYRGAALVEHRIQGALDGTLDLGEAEVPVRYAFETRSDVAYMPAQLTLGTSYRPHPSTLVTAELAWQRYSGYRSPYTETSSHLVHGPELDVEVPDTVLVPAPPGRLHDRFVPRLAVEPQFQLTAGLGLVLRAGYAFQRSPLPRAQTQTRFMDLDRHLLTAGVGATWLEPSVPFRSIGLDLAVADALGVPRRTTTLTGPNADRASGHVLLMSASLVLSFGDASP
jgi:long-subunit fatty acid transport protein